MPPAAKSSGRHVDRLWAGRGASEAGEAADRGSQQGGKEGDQCQIIHEGEYAGRPIKWGDVPDQQAQQQKAGPSEDQKEGVFPLFQVDADRAEGANGDQEHPQQHDQMQSNGKIQIEFLGGDIGGGGGHIQPEDNGGIEKIHFHMIDYFGIGLI